uniref:Uncharacterized protein n=1 Tax=Timema monikensis TaxID=170555 RepID=A0A7R9E6A1_9NEOP|nr:unnamed protein product [Timema monikensis]
MAMGSTEHSLINVHPTEIRASISPSSAVELNTTIALANYATEAGRYVYTIESCIKHGSTYEPMKADSKVYSGASLVLSGLLVRGRLWFESERSVRLIYTNLYTPSLILPTRLFPIQPIFLCPLQSLCTQTEVQRRLKRTKVLAVGLGGSLRRNHSGKLQSGLQFQMFYYRDSQNGAREIVQGILPSLTTNAGKPDQDEVDYTAGMPTAAVGYQSTVDRTYLSQCRKRTVGLENPTMHPDLGGPWAPWADPC